MSVEPIIPNLKGLAQQCCLRGLYIPDRYLYRLDSWESVRQFSYQADNHHQNNRTNSCRYKCRGKTAADGYSEFGKDIFADKSSQDTDDNIYD